MERHKVLQRQLKRYQLSDTQCPTDLNQWRGFLNRINLAYVALDEDRYLSERIRLVSAHEMEELNKQLISAARETGMAEVAISVLHNIGNVLNSLNVSIDIIQQKLKNTKLSNLEKIVSMLDEHKKNIADFLTHDEKGKHIINYLRKLSDYWQKEYKSYLKELKSLAKNVDHIKTIVSRQQAISGKASMVELCDPIDILEDAIDISFSKTTQHDIQIIRHYDTEKKIMLDRIKLHQILVNLLNNAKDALNAARNVKEKKIILRTNEDAEFFQILISDNGIGISPKDLDKIYLFGFTTKKSGHGFGLHASYLAAKEMNANLSAQSNGLNKGSTFIIEFPKEQK